MQEIKAICNRVIIINKGEIVADYHDISKIYAFDENSMEFEVEFLNKVEIAELEVIENINSVTAISDKRFALITSADVRSAVFDFAVKTKNTILTIKAVEKSMEDVFRSLTK